MVESTGLSQEVFSLSSVSRTSLIRWYFTLALVEGVIVLIVLLSVPGRSLGMWFVGLSTGRIVLLIFCLLLNTILLWVVLNLWRDASWRNKFANRVIFELDRERVYWSVILLAVLGFVVNLYFLFIGSRIAEVFPGIYKDMKFTFSVWSILFFRNYFIHLAPIAVWAIILSVQTMLTVRVIRYGTNLRVFKPYRKNLIALFLVFGIFFLLSVWIIRTGFGTVPDEVGWGVPGVPILPTQVLLASLIALVGFAIGAFLIFIFKPGFAHIYYIRLSTGTMDLIICLIIWVVAVLLWMEEPLKPNWFSPTPLPPNYEYYPYSDAANFDISAHSLLIGNGLEKGVIRPVYSVFLALIQAFNGIGYQKVIEWQILVMATIPSLLYLITKTLHHRLSGVLVGVLAIFHEINSISFSGVIDVSHSKLIMSDLPTTLGIILITLIVVLWLKKPDRRMLFPLLVGGILVLVMLIRTQVAILLPAILISSWLVLSHQPKTWLKSVFLLFLGILLVLSPWLWRNWQVTGEIAFTEAAQTSQAGLIGRRYSLSPYEQDNYQRNDETDSEYLSRMVRSAIQFAYEHPFETSRFIASHFLHNQISTILVLPASFTLSDNLAEFYSMLPKGGSAKPFEEWNQCCSLSDYIKKLGYWKTWNGILAKETILPLLTSMFLISIGLSVSWDRFGIIGLFPLFVNVSYSLSNALVRTSGWRFNLPVDWVGMMYYGIGLIQIFFWLVMFFGNRLFPSRFRPQEDYASIELDDNRIPWNKVVFIGLILFLISASIPIAERFIPKRYEDYNAQVVLSTLFKQDFWLSSGINSSTVENFLQQSNAVALFGRGLYPRFYSSGQGEPDRSWPSYKRREYDRLGFILLGPDRQSVILRTQKPPAYFPNASDIFVFGCAQEDYIDAYVIVFLDSSNEILMRSPLQKWACPE